MLCYRNQRDEKSVYCVFRTIKCNCALQPCGHKDLCKNCADKLDGTCHVCSENRERLLLYTVANTHTMPNTATYIFYNCTGTVMPCMHFILFCNKYCILHACMHMI